jgi:hypothetical protein
MTTDEPFYLGAYWGARRESVDACTERLASCLAGLARCSASLSGWSTKAGRGRGGVAVEGADVGALRDLLPAGVHRRDADESPIEELGFSLGLWNGDRDAPVGLSVTCGSWTATPGVMNSFVLALPSPGEAEQLYGREAALCLMRAAVTAWQPDWATLTSCELADALDAPTREPSLGWITFLGDQRPVPGRPSVGHREELQDGTVLVSAERVQDVDVSKVRDLAGELRSAGSLAPTP